MSNDKILDAEEKSPEALDEPGEQHEFYKEFDFLVKLRNGGSINMLGAPPVLAKAFGIDKESATDIFWKWSESL
jgi:hypothetical protein